MIKVAVNGALGRMGCRILSLAYHSQDFKIKAAFEQKSNSSFGKDIGGLLGFGENIKVKLSAVTSAALKGVNVLIDFSGPEGTQDCLKACVQSKVALVIGTTGIGADGAANIKKASQKIPILFSPNMSIGANFLFEMARLSAKALSAGYDIEIIEAHHRLKKDAPSGTAKKIAEIIVQEKGWDLGRVAKYGREGTTGERPKDEIGIHVIRAGDIVGEHTVLFSGPGETIELKHVALSRDAFAKGALVAAQFLSKKKPGFYTMTDVMNR